MASTIKHLTGQKKRRQFRHTPSCGDPFSNKRNIVYKKKGHLVYLDADDDDSALILVIQLWHLNTKALARLYLFLA